jgi:hypothetical protein
MNNKNPNLIKIWGKEEGKGKERKKGNKRRKENLQLNRRYFPDRVSCIFPRLASECNPPTSSRNPISTSQVAGITGMSHHTHIWKFIFIKPLLHTMTIMKLRWIISLNMKAKTSRKKNPVIFRQRFL